MVPPPRLAPLHRFSRTGPSMATSTRPVCWLSQHMQGTMMISLRAQTHMSGLPSARVPTRWSRMLRHRRKRRVLPVRHKWRLEPLSLWTRTCALQRSRMVAASPRTAAFDASVRASRIAMAKATVTTARPSANTSFANLVTAPTRHAPKYTLGNII